MLNLLEISKRMQSCSCLLIVRLLGLTGQQSTPDVLTFRDRCCQNQNSPSWKVAAKLVNNNLFCNKSGTNVAAIKRNDVYMKRMIIAAVAAFAFLFGSADANAQIKLDQTIPGNNASFIDLGKIGIDAVRTADGGIMTSSEYILYAKTTKDNVFFGIACQPVMGVSELMEVALGKSIDEAKESIDTLIDWLHFSAVGDVTSFVDMEGRNFQLSRKLSEIRVIQLSDGNSQREVACFVRGDILSKAKDKLNIRSATAVYDRLNAMGMENHPFCAWYNETVPQVPRYRIEESTAELEAAEVELMQAMGTSKAEEIQDLHAELEWVRKALTVSRLNDGLPADARDRVKIKAVKSVISVIESELNREQLDNVLIDSAFAALNNYADREVIWSTEREQIEKLWNKYQKKIKGFARC